VKATVFLGGGRITGALVTGLRRAGYRTPIVVHDRNAYKLRCLKQELGVLTEADLRRAVARAHFLILAVRPDSVADLLTRLRPLVEEARPRARSTLIACSLAAGIPLTRLRARLPVRWARAMPSPACRSGNGLTALTFPRGFPARGRKEVVEFFRQLGPVLMIPESKFDVFTATYSCSHGYYALATLAGAARKLGLDGKTALAAAAHALADGIVAWREGNVPLAKLLEQAATPGGIAATVTGAMRSAGQARIVERGLRAGVARARRYARC
jgi:pyrroline-5-carboxylate reductase